MLRDTYHDYITDEEVCDLGFWAAKQWQKRIADLWRRSGGHTPSAVMRIEYDPSVMVTRASVSFDSRAWTGR